MMGWYTHIAALNEGIAETKAELAGLVTTHQAVKAFVQGQVQYLELVKHRALNEGNWKAVAGLDIALFEIKRLGEPIKHTSKEIDDQMGVSRTTGAAQIFDFKIALGVLDGESKAEVYEALLALKARYKFSLSEDRKVLDQLKNIKQAKAA